MGEILVSVIIPIYNGEKYLNQAVESIMCQPMRKNIEIVLINDGSMDNSHQICNELKDKYSNIVYYKKENTGIGLTRNFGILKARGKYLAFLDQDDVWAKDFFTEEIVNEIQKAADVYGFSYYRSNNDFTRGKMIRVKNEEIVGGGIASVQSSWNHHSSLIYKREMVINEEIFSPSTRHEDEIFRHKCLYVAKKVVYIDKLIFLYRNNPTSETHRKQEPQLLYGPILNTWRELIDWHLEKEPRDDEIIRLCEMMMCLYGIEGIEALYQFGLPTKKIRNIVKEFFYEEILSKYKNIRMSKINYQRLDEYYNFNEKFALKNRVKGLVIRILKNMSKVSFLRNMYDKKRYPTVLEQ